MQNRPRVAVILFGQPRNVDSKLASTSIRFWLKNCYVDYFGHCWYSNDHSTTYVQKSLHHNLATALNIPVNAPELIKKQYPEINLIVEKPRSFEKEALAMKSCLDASLTSIHPENGVLFPIFLSQFHSIAQALELFFNSSREGYYDFVVLMRYDIFVLRNPNLKTLPKDKLIVNHMRHGFSDLIFIGPPEMVQALNVFPILSRLITNNIDNCPESLKMAAFLEKYTIQNVVTKRMIFNIIRTKDYRSQVYWSGLMIKKYYKTWFSKAILKRR